MGNRTPRTGYVNGFVLQKGKLPFRDEAELARDDGRDHGSVAGRGLPLPVRADVERVRQPGYSDGNDLDVGIEVVLDGVATRPSGLAADGSQALSQAFVASCTMIATCTRLLTSSLLSSRDT
ncbi:hypothetical protein GCM10027601_21640 [Nocardioides ungokensis]